MHALIILLSLSFGTLAVSGCDKSDSEKGESAESVEDGHDVVESGTYEGTIKKVKPDESEIYVDVDGKELELYFIDETKLTRGDEPVKFSELAEGQKVEVEVKKVGKRLDPLSVKILE